MAIDPIQFGKNLRPATVEALNKINELITAVNALDPESISTLEQTVSTQGQSISTLQTQMSNANSSIETLQSTQKTHSSDIDNIKVTLFTPLESTENE